MTTSHARGSVEFGDPATYRIVVQGRLREDCRRRFAGMSIEDIRDEGGVERTSLTGPILDQAELRGVLDALYGLHMSVVAVALCDADRTGETEFTRETRA
jgi:hypothetical protein